MSLDARAIALQGVGFAPILLALQGFADAGLAVVVPARPVGGLGRSKGRRRRIELPRIDEIDIVTPPFILPQIGPLPIVPVRPARTARVRRRETAMLIAIGVLRR